MRLYSIPEIIEVLHKQTHPMKHNNDYPTNAVVWGTIVDLEPLMKLSGKGVEIGELIPGEHPDEINPRAGSWMEERRNWMKQVELLENENRSLKIQCDMIGEIK